MAQVNVIQPRFGRIVVTSTNLSNYSFHVVPDSGYKVTAARLFCHACERYLITTPSGTGFYHFDIQSLIDDDHPGPFDISVVLSVIPKYSIEIATSSSPSEGGTTNYSPSKVIYSGTYATSRSVTITATPAIGWRFVKWTNDYEPAWESTSQSVTFTVTCGGLEPNNALFAYTAHFAKRSYVITGVASPAGSGVVSGGGTYAYGSSVTLTATANAKWRFVRWQDDPAAAATRTVTVGAENKTFVAEFEQYLFDISGVCNPAAGGVVNGGGRGETGDTFELTAVPGQRYRFVKWEDDPAEPSVRTVTVGNSDRVYVAIVERYLTMITGVASPANGGTVTGGGLKVIGSSVTLVATPAAGYRFVGWRDDHDAGATRTFECPYDDTTYVAEFYPIGKAGVFVEVWPDILGRLGVVTISGDGTYDIGDEVTVSVDVDTKYEGLRHGGLFDKGSGKFLTSDKTYTFVVEEDTTLVELLVLKAPLAFCNPLKLNDGTVFDPETDWTDLDRSWTPTGGTASVEVDFPDGVWSGGFAWRHGYPPGVRVEGIVYEVPYTTVRTAGLQLYAPLEKRSALRGTFSKPMEHYRFLTKGKEFSGTVLTWYGILVFYVFNDHVMYCPDDKVAYGTNDKVVASY